MDDPNERHLRPFTDISAALTPPLHWNLVAGLLGNLLLFAPLGGALRTSRVRAPAAIGCGLVLSSCIEIGQMFVPGRTTATDDVLLNTVGTAIGYAVATAALRLAAQRRAA